MATEIRAVIADDEHLARMRLRRLCELAGDVAIVAEAKDSDDALAQVAEHRPHVVFLDVQMPGRGGLGVGQAMSREAKSDRASREMPLVVFVTAYRDYAVGAFGVGAIDYLLKPFDRERLQTTLDRVRHHLGKALDEPAATGPARAVARATIGTIPTATAPAFSSQAIAALPRAERLVVRSGFRTQFVDVRDVDYIVAEGNYVSVFTADKSYLLRETMNAMEARLDSRVFVRVHRSAIVRVDRIEEIEPTPSGEYVLRLRGGAKVVSSRGARARLFAALGLPR